MWGTKKITKTRFHAYPAINPMSTASIHQPRVQHHLSRNKPCPLQRFSTTLVGNLTARTLLHYTSVIDRIDRSFLARASVRRADSVFGAFEKFEFFFDEYQEMKSSSRKAGGNPEKRAP